MSTRVDASAIRRQCAATTAAATTTTAGHRRSGSTAATTEATTTTTTLGQESGQSAAFASAFHPSEPHPAAAPLAAGIRQPGTRTAASDEPDPPGSGSARPRDEPTDRVGTQQSARWQQSTAAHGRRVTARLRHARQPPLSLDEESIR